MIVLRLLLLCALTAVVAGCADDEDEAAAPARAETALVVRVDADGPRGAGRAKETTIRCEPGDTSRACKAAARLKPADFGPLPNDIACIELFGGPQTARISGRLRGEPVSTSLSRSDGCEINRWEGFKALLAQAG